MELFANGALRFLLRLSVVAQNLPTHLFRDHTAIIKRQRNITIITKTVTIINYVQTCSITLCRQMPTNPEMVRNASNSSRQKAGEENRNRLSHVIRTIEFCGRQEIPLRVHRDAGGFSLNETDCNDGVLKAALRLRLEAADKQTSDLFKGSPQRFIFKLESAKSNYIFDR